MIIWGNDKDNNFTKGFSKKLPFGIYNLQVIKFVGVPEKNFKFIRTKSNESFSIAKSAGDPITLVKYKTRDVIQQSTKEFLDDVQLHVLNVFNTLYREVMLPDNRVRLVLQPDIKDKSTLEKGTWINGMSTITLYAVLPWNRNPNIGDTIWNDTVVCGLAQVPRTTQTGVDIAVSCDESARFCLSPLPIINHEIEHSIGWLHTGNVSKIGMRIRGITQSDTGYLEARSSLAALYDNPTGSSPINRNNFTVIKGRIDAKYFPFAGDIKNFIAVLVIDNKVKIQSTVDINGEFRFYVFKTDEDGKTLQGRRAKIILIKILDNSKRDIELIESKQIEFKLNYASEFKNSITTSITNIVDDVLIRLRSIKIFYRFMNLVVARNFDADLTGSIKSVEVIERRIKMLSEKEDVDIDMLSTLLHTTPFIYSITKITISESIELRTPVQFNKGTLTVDLFKQVEGISLKD